MGSLEKSEANSFVSVGLVKGRCLCALCSEKVGWVEFSRAGNCSIHDGL